MIIEIYFMTYLHVGGMRSGAKKRNRDDGGDVALFHPSGHPSFRTHAGEDPDDVKSSFHTCGDLWVTQHCHCLRCEVIRFGLIRQRVESQNLTCFTVIVDLDNYGAEEFAKAFPYVMPRNVVVWSFYGACFERHFRHLPDVDGATASSLWSQTRGRHVFTPCGAHAQATDRVILTILKVMERNSAMVITGDRNLASQCEAVDGVKVVNVTELRRKWNLVAAAMWKWVERHSD